MLSMPTVHAQLSGDDGIYQTVYMMRDLVNKAYLHPWIRERATRLVSGCRRDVNCEDRTLNGYVNRAMQFVRDPTDVEALHDPVTYVEANLRQGIRPAGDCDDLSLYLAALLKSIGHRPSFTIIDRFGKGFHHIFVWCDGNDLDPTLLNVGERDKPKRQLWFDI